MCLTCSSNTGMGLHSKISRFVSSVTYWSKHLLKLQLMFVLICFVLQQRRSGCPAEASRDPLGYVEMTPTQSWNRKWNWLIVGTGFYPSIFVVWWSQNHPFQARMSFNLAATAPSSGCQTKYAWKPRISKRETIKSKVEKSGTCELWALTHVWAFFLRE